MSDEKKYRRIVSSWSYPPRPIVDLRSDLQKQKDWERNFINVHRSMLYGGSPNTSKEYIDLLVEHYIKTYGEEP